MSKAISTGDIEVCADSLEVLNKCGKLPFEIKDFVKVSTWKELALQVLID